MLCNIIFIVFNIVCLFVWRLCSFFLSFFPSFFYLYFFLSIRLRQTSLTEKSCERISPLLSSKSSTLRELDLSFNGLLSVGPESPHCKLRSVNMKWRNGLDIQTYNQGLIHLNMSFPSPRTSQLLCFTGFINPSKLWKKIIIHIKNINKIQLVTKR